MGIMKRTIEVPNPWTADIVKSLKVKKDDSMPGV
jgi:hypothetical protein